MRESERKRKQLRKRKRERGKKKKEGKRKISHIFLLDCHVTGLIMGNLPAGVGHCSAHHKGNNVF